MFDRSDNKETVFDRFRSDNKATVFDRSDNKEAVFDKFRSDNKETAFGIGGWRLL